MSPTQPTSPSKSSHNKSPGLLRQGHPRPSLWVGYVLLCLTWTINGYDIPFNATQPLHDHQFDKARKSNQLNLLYFWGNGCVLCEPVIPVIEELAIEYRDHPLVKIYFVDLDHDTQIRAQAKVPLSALRIYYENQQVDLQERTKEAIMGKISQVLESDFVTLSGESEQLPSIPENHVIVYSKPKPKGLRLLQFKLLKTQFEERPIYRVDNEGPIFLEYRTNGGIYTFKEKKQPLESVLDWLVQVGTPLMDDLLRIQSSLRLNRAYKKKVPFLALVIRDDNPHALKVLERFCKVNEEYQCGTVIPGAKGYDLFETYLMDKDNPHSRLAFLDLAMNERFFYPGNLAQLTPTAIDQFIEDAKQLKLKPIGGSRPRVYEYERLRKLRAQKEGKAHPESEEL